MMMAVALSCGARDRRPKSTTLPLPPPPRPHCYPGHHRDPHAGKQSSQASTRAQNIENNPGGLSETSNMFADPDRRYDASGSNIPLGSVAEALPVPHQRATRAHRLITETRGGEQDDTMSEIRQHNVPEKNDAKERAMDGVEDLVLSLLRQITDFSRENLLEENTQERNQISKNKTPPKVRIQLVDRRKAALKRSFRNITYPSKINGSGSRQLARLYRTLDIIHQALAENLPVTKRDIYYQDVQLFGSQSVVDNLIDDISATFDLERSDLNVHATSKGLVCSSGLTILLHNGEHIVVNNSEGTLIPGGNNIRRIEFSRSLSWVLIVEKDAVFQTLCQLSLVNDTNLPGPGIIITGKGYPDLATRQLIKHFSDTLPQSIPILALVDGDAYGIDILSVYKFGSRSMQHQRESLAAERIQWIGLRASQLAKFGVDDDYLLPMTAHDQKKVCSCSSSYLWVVFCLIKPRIKPDNHDLHVLQAISLLNRSSNPLPQAWRSVPSLSTIIITIVIITNPISSLNSALHLTLFCIHSSFIYFAIHRQELLTMLQTGKKAEIEVLSTAIATISASSPSPNSPAQINVDAGTSSSSMSSATKTASQSHHHPYHHLPKVPGAQTSPLLRYLRSEITAAVTRATKRLADSHEFSI